MTRLLETLTTGVGAFAATNLDDLFLLVAFYAASPGRVRQIVAGQYLGIAALFAASAACALLALVVPPAWIALLGLAPLALGIKQLVARGGRESEESEESEARALLARSGAAPLGVLSVASVTVANGGDNLGVYIPLFSSQLRGVPVFALVFAVMTALWCGAAARLVGDARVGPWLRRTGPRVLPFVLIGLGLAILWRARALLAPLLLLLR